MTGTAANAPAALHAATAMRGRPASAVAHRGSQLCKRGRGAQARGGGIRGGSEAPRHAACHARIRRPQANGKIGRVRREIGAARPLRPSRLGRPPGAIGRGPLAAGSPFHSEGGGGGWGGRRTHSSARVVQLQRSHAARRGRGGGGGVRPQDAPNGTGHGRAAGYCPYA